jgi:tetratricopeptide (TPR) repeat protein
MESWHGRKISPVYQLMPNLQEPDWKSLRIGEVREFWDLYDTWERRVKLARQESLIGDLLVLADEAPIAAFRAEAWIRAGEALRKAEHFDFALEQLERGLEIEPASLKGLREKGICLQRLAAAGLAEHSLERVREHYREVLEIRPDDPETWALLGRVDKDAWVQTWDLAGKSPEEKREDAAWEDALLRNAIAAYNQGFRRNPGHYYSGINALTLMHVYRDLTGDSRYDQDMRLLGGAVRFAAECERDDGLSFWSRATMGDLEVLTGTPDTVKSAFKEAIAVNERDWFGLSSCRAQLSMLEKLSVYRDNVDAGIATFDRAMSRLRQPDRAWQPRHLLLFSGHMIDAPNRASPRFPRSKASAAGERIAQALQRLGAGPEDLALTQGACGGDLLFTEACLSLGVKVQWLQPFDEPEFMQRSVVCSGDDWRHRYFAAKSGLAGPIRTAPQALGEHPRNLGSGYAYERCNLWLLFTALAHGIEKVRFICLWNGAGGDGPGGTAHMFKEVQRRTGKVDWIDTREL